MQTLSGHSQSHTLEFCCSSSQFLVPGISCCRANRSKVFGLKTAATFSDSAFGECLAKTWHPLPGSNVAMVSKRATFQAWCLRWAAQVAHDGLSLSLSLCSLVSYRASLFNQLLQCFTQYRRTEKQFKSGSYKAYEELRLELAQCHIHQILLFQSKS